MNISIRAADPKDADTVAELIGEPLGEIIQAIGVQAFHFDHAETKERAKKFMERGIYSVLIASDTSNQAFRYAE